MPIYRYRCPKCQEEEEALIPMSHRNDERFHSCGAIMERLMTIPCVAIFRTTNKERVLDTLNTEAKSPIVDGAPVRSKRSQQALAKGLDYVRSLEDKVFTGFG
jgi:putative FmdB family regulatory protein